MLPPRDDFLRHRKRDASPSDPTAQIILCAPGSQTYIKLTRRPSNGVSDDKSYQEAQEQITQLVGNTWTFIHREHLANGHEDGVIDKGEGWVLERKSSHGSFMLQVANAHHKEYYPRIHFGGVRIVGNEITWGVLRAALMALGEYMNGEWTECEFEIWDGKNQVGTARIVATK
ncbi:MAG: hypothetical protein Q9225_003143 [Loekoesia sp. 1 TL-2023]